MGGDGAPVETDRFAAPQPLFLIARLHHGAADAATLAQRSTTTADRLGLTPKPALATVRRQCGNTHLLISSQCDGQRALLHDPATPQARPTIEPVEASGARWSGDLILITSESLRER